MAVPSAPSSITLSAGLDVSSYTVAISWASSVDASGYSLSSSTTLSSSFTELSSGITGLTYTDTDVASGNIYYKLTADNVDGSSSYILAGIYLSGTSVGPRTISKVKPTTPVLNTGHELYSRLACYLTFNEGSGDTAADLTANGNDATCNVATPNWGSDAEVGDFWTTSTSGGNQIFTIPTSASLQAATAGFTIGVKFKGDASALSWSYNGSPIFGTSTSDFCKTYGYLNEETLRAQMTTSAGTASTSAGAWDSAYEGRSGAWVWLILTWDGTNLEFYEDSTLIESVALSGTLTFDEDVILGSAGTPGSYCPYYSYGACFILDDGMTSTEVANLVADEWSLISGSTGPDAPTGLSLDQDGASIKVGIDDLLDATAATVRIERRKDGGSWGTVDTVSVTPSFTPANAASPMGVNLQEATYYDSSLPFKDLFRLSSEWIPQEPGGFSPWDTGIPLTLGSDGYPSTLGGSEAANCLLVRAIGGNYQSGTYHLYHDGTGTIGVGGDASSLSSVGTGHYTFTVTTPSDTGIYVKINTTSAAPNHVRNIRVVHEDDIATYASARWNPDFVSKLAKFSVLRFMDWMNVNSSPVVDYADYQLPDGYKSWAKDDGVYMPIAVMADLCNTCSADMWLNIPHQATNACASAMIQAAYDALDSDRKLYVEYSNECWNSSFAQELYCRTNGVSEALDADQYVARDYWYASRAEEVFALASAIFPASRLVRVIGAQAASTTVSNRILAYGTTASNTDALAIAPYFYDNRAEATIVAGDETDCMDECESSITTSLGWVASQKTIADTHSVDLIAYEGGPHLIAAFYSTPNQSAATTIFIDANESSRMGDLCKTYLEGWRSNNANSLFCWYTFCGDYDKFGMWGANRYLGTDLAKYTKVNEYTDENPTYYLEDTLTETGTYDYRAVAIDGSANESVASTSAQVVFGTDDLKPLYPTATKDGVDVDLAWQTVKGADSYIVQRRTDGGTWEVIG